MIIPILFLLVYGSDSARSVVIRSKCDADGKQMKYSTWLSTVDEREWRFLKGSGDGNYYVAVFIEPPNKLIYCFRRVGSWKGIKESTLAITTDDGAGAICLEKESKVLQKSIRVESNMGSGQAMQTYGYVYYLKKSAPRCIRVTWSVRHIGADSFHKEFDEKVALPEVSDRKRGVSYSGTSHNTPRGKSRSQRRKRNR